MKKFVHIERVGQAFSTRNGAFVALRDIDLTVEQGEFITLISHSSCDKSTLLNLIAGLTRPTSGVLLCAECEITGTGPDRAVVFQNHSLLLWLTLLPEHAPGRGTGLRHHRETCPAGPDRTRTARWSWWGGLLPAQNKLPRPSYRAKISDGMKKSSARGLCPHAGDRARRAADGRTLRHAGRADPCASCGTSCSRSWPRQRTTIIMVTHDVDEAVLLSDRIVMLINGSAATIGRDPACAVATSA